MSRQRYSIDSMTDFATIIACGGRAARFGADKRRQVLGGQTLLQRAIARTAAYGGPVALAVRERAQVPHTRLPVLVDPQGDMGPIGALASGFAFAREAGCGHVLLIACDQPFLPADLPQRLARSLGDAGVALPVSAGHDQNMAGLWRCDRQELDAYLGSGRRSLWGFAEQVGIARALWDDEDADPFADIDTPADLIAARTRIKEE